MKIHNDLLHLVQEALAKDSTLKACLENIYILVYDGTVIMAGTVTNESLKAVAHKIVSAVPGVNLLIDDLKVVTSAQQRVNVQIDWEKERMALT